MYVDVDVVKLSWYLPLQTLLRLFSSMASTVTMSRVVNGIHADIDVIQRVSLTLEPLGLFSAMPGTRPVVAVVDGVDFDVDVVQAGRSLALLTLLLFTFWLYRARSVAAAGTPCTGSMAAVVDGLHVDVDIVERVDSALESLLGLFPSMASTRSMVAVVDRINFNVDVVERPGRLALETFRLFAARMDPTSTVV